MIDDPQLLRHPVLPGMGNYVAGVLAIYPRSVAPTRGPASWAN